MPAIYHNLMPPFSMKEVVVSTMPALKFQVEDTSIDNHSAYFPKENLRTPQKLYGAFSYFPSKKSSIDVLD